MVGFFVLLIFSAKVSGSHYNPAVTLAFMLRRDTGKFSRPLGIAYIAFQFAGGFLGGLLSYLFIQDTVMFGISDVTDVGFAFTSEVIGSFFVVFLYLTQTEAKTKLSKDPAITTLIIAAAYIGALLMVSGP
jgi:glycerol uptake facilitator-like aquaporin